ncbi:redoxin domain-containing protein [Phenylobacterium sp.]|uniref:redoxin domain-containing protein n=1 Tax=Phenylobacterium sp. TaxID=1871053 RepID=UPI00286B7565|nr:redoxin domain-containing protein [Phenylobacterium sp.]
MVSISRRALLAAAGLGALGATGAVVWAQSALTSFERAGEEPLVLGDRGPAPELTGIEGWLNSEPLALSRLAGRPVLLDFWTFDCINCVRTLPHVRKWHSAYAERGLAVIGVHSPEFPHERKRERVAAAAARYGVDYPIALDTDHATWDAYGVRYWPSLFLIDQRGRIVMRHEGEGEYATIERLIQTVLTR